MSKSEEKFDGFETPDSNLNGPDVRRYTMKVEETSVDVLHDEAKAAVRRANIHMLREHGYLTDEDPTDTEIQEALHQYGINQTKEIENKGLGGLKQWLSI